MDRQPTLREEVWASGTAYEPYVGRWSRLVARELLAWLDVPADRAWLDVGCGTGALARTILESAAPRSVLGVDRSEAYLAFAATGAADPRLRLVPGDAQALPVEDHAFDAAVSGLMLNFLADPARAVAEMARATRPGGVVSAYVWDYAGEMQMMRRFWDAAVALDPAAAERDEGRRFPICRPEPLQRLFESVGLGRVEVRGVEVPTRFRDFEDYWSPFLGGQGPAPSYVAALDPREREALRAHLQQALPVAPDGSIPLVARAWAVRGVP